MNHEPEARQVLAAHYAIPNPTLQVLRSTGGAIKDVFKVQTGSDTYVLKRYRTDYRTPRDVTAMHEAQEFLRAGDLPVPAVIPTKDGNLVQGTETDTWVLYQQAAGSHHPLGQIPARPAAALGETVGQIAHRFTGWRTGWQGAEQLGVYPPEERIPLYEALLRQAEQGSTPLDQVCVRVIRYRIGALERMAQFTPRILALEHQWVHGDINDGNILFTGDRVSGIIDFDNLRLAPRGFDFIYGLNRCFAPGQPEREEYARAYMRTVRPTPAEVELWAPMWLCFEVGDIWPLDRTLLNAEGHIYAYRPTTHVDPPDDTWERQIDTTTEWLLRLLSS